MNSVGKPTREPPRAPVTIIYVPGLGHDDSNTAETVADSIAHEADRLSSRKVEATKEHVPTATLGLRPVRTIVAGQARLADLFELDYREALEGLAKSGDKEGVAPSLIAQTLYTLRGVTYVFRARNRPNKDRRAKIQLALGFGAAFVLSLVFLLTLLGALASVVIQLGWDKWTPSWAVDSAPWVALSGGVISAATLARWRDDLLRSARRMRQLLCFFDEEDQRAEVTNAVGDAVDKLREAEYDGEVHVLGYSFGALVVLDAFTTAGAGQLAPEGIRGTTAVTTVGCPVDLVQLYRPEYFAARRAWREDLPWENVFIPSDALASNFHLGDDRVAGRAALGNWAMTNHSYLASEQLTYGGIIFQWAGLRKHNRYWRESGGCWSQEILERWKLL